MTINSIREMLGREPFQPFRIPASSGAGYEVRNPDLVVVLRSQIFVAEANSDRFALVPFLHVAGVELLGNGRASRTRRSR